MENQVKNVSEKLDSLTGSSQDEVGQCLQCLLLLSFIKIFEVTETSSTLSRKGLNGVSRKTAKNLAVRRKIETF